MARFKVSPHDRSFVPKPRTQVGYAVSGGKPRAWLHRRGGQSWVDPYAIAGVSWFDSVTIALEVSFTTQPYQNPSWTDISSYVQSVSIQRGRATQLDQFSAGTMTVKLLNSDRRFDPSYTSGTYYPNVLPRKKIRLRVRYNSVTYDLFTGFVDSWPQEGEPSNNLGTVTLTATDGFKMLSRQNLTNTGVAIADGERVSDRIHRLLDFPGWPFADRDIDTDSPRVIALTPTGQTVMSELYTTATGDLGILFIKADGKLCYRGHRWQMQNNLVASATFGESSAASELGYATIVLPYGDTNLFNRATMTYGSPAATVDRRNQTSMDAYGESTKGLGTTNIRNGNVATNTVEWVVAYYGQPQLRVEQLEVKPRAAASTLFPVVLAGEIGARWTVKRRPQNVGSAISQDVIVEGVTHEIGLDTWSSTFNLGPAPVTSAGGAYWTVGTSLLGTTTVWA